MQSVSSGHCKPTIPSTDSQRSLEWSHSALGDKLERVNNAAGKKTCCKKGINYDWKLGILAEDLKMKKINLLISFLTWEKILKVSSLFKKITVKKPYYLNHIIKVKK